MTTANQTNLINAFTRNFKRLAGCPVSRESREKVEVYPNHYERIENLQTFLVGVMVFIGIAACALAILLLPSCNKQAFADEMPADFYIAEVDIVNAIYQIEGGSHAKKPFGILSVPCNSYAECRKVCLTTVKNNKTRFLKADRSKYGNSYLAFLASRYAPLNAKNDPKGLNKNWLRNIKSKLGGAK